MPKAFDPLVSVIIPAYNAEQFITKTVDNVFQQTWKSIELIIVNDGSSDRTKEVLQPYLGDSRLVYIEQQNLGSSTAKNTGLQRATGDFIQYLDADDLLSANKIELQVKALLRNPGRMAVCKTVRFKTDPAIDAADEIDTNFLYDTEDALAFVLNLYGIDGRHGMIQPNAFLVPREIVTKIGSWNTRLSFASNEDAEYFCRAMLASNGMVFTPDAINYYKTGTAGSLSKQHSYKHAHATLGVWLTIAQHLLAKENTARVKSMMAKHVSQFIYQHFDQHPALIKMADVELKKLGCKDWPVEGGRKIKLLAKMVGMKKALLFRRKVRSVVHKACIPAFNRLKSLVSI